MTPSEKHDQPEHAGGNTGLSRQPRQATGADLRAIRSVIVAAYSRYRDRMDKPPGPVLADYTDAVAAGRVWVLGVSPAAQGTGLGRRLMEFAEQQALSRGLRRMTLYTHEVMTENLAIYARLGYSETERRTEGGYSRVFMAKELRG